MDLENKDFSTLAGLMAIIDAVPIACILRGEDYKVVHMNKIVAKLFELPDENMYKERFDELSPPYQPEGTPSRSKATALLRDCLESGRTMSFDWVHSLPDKKLMPTVVTLTRVFAENKPYVLIFKQDMRESRQVRLQERLNRERLQAMMDSCPMACAILDTHFNVMECNQVVMDVFNLNHKQAFIDRFFELSPEYQPDGQLSRKKALDKLAQTFEGGRIHYEWLHQTLKGEQIPCEVTLVRVHLANEDLAIIYIHDLREINKSMEMAERMESIAYTDDLTKLYTRRYFMENAERQLKENKEKNEPYHVIMADLDHFKSVNDNYGHLIGDEVLKIAAKRMQGITRKGTVLARYGGEEFIIQLTEISYEDAVKTARRIQRSIEESKFAIKGINIAITISLGVATLTSPRDTLNDLIYMADTALYGAKRTGRNKVMEYGEAKDINWLAY